MRRWIWIGPLLYVAVAGLSVLGSEEPLEALATRAPFALVFVAIAAYLGRARRRPVEKIVTGLLEESPGCDMLGPRRLSMDEEGFRETSDFIESYVKWAAVE